MFVTCGCLLWTQQTQSHFGHHLFYQQLWLLKLRALTLASSFWDCLQRRNPCCTCSGTRCRRRAPKPRSPPLRAWRWARLEPPDIRFCSRPRGRTTGRLLNTPGGRCHLRASIGEWDVDVHSARHTRGSRLVTIMIQGSSLVWSDLLMLHSIFIQGAKRFKVAQKVDAWMLDVTFGQQWLPLSQRCDSKTLNECNYQLNVQYSVHGWATENEDLSVLKNTHPVKRELNSCVFTVFVDAFGLNLRTDALWKNKK